MDRNAMPEKSITVTKLAKQCDISPQHVRNLTGEGIFHRSTDDEGNELRGRYPELSVREYVRYLRKLSRLDDSSESILSALKNRRMASEAEMSELRLKQFKGALHHAADVEFVMTNMLTFFKQRVLAIPSRLTRLLIGKKKFKEIYDLLMGEITLCLRELSGYDPQMFEQQTAARLAEQGVEMAALNGNERQEGKAAATNGRHALAG